MTTKKILNSTLICMTVWFFSGCGNSAENKPTPTPTPTPTVTPTPTPIIKKISYVSTNPDKQVFVGEVIYIEGEEINFDFLADMIDSYETGTFLIKFFLDGTPPSTTELMEQLLGDVATSEITGVNTLNYTLEDPNKMVIRGRIEYDIASEINFDFLVDEISKFETGIFNVILGINESDFGSTKKTGQTKVVQKNDDGFYQAGLNRTSVRFNDMLNDLTTNLVWQDNASVLTVKKPWITEDNYSSERFSDTSGDTATTYCKTLTLGDYNNWRLPTLHELQNIVNYDKNGPAMDDVYQNKNSNTYWTADSNSGSYPRAAWTVSFSLGALGYHDKDTKLLVRCVREVQ